MTGTDVYHYQIGVGFALRLQRRISLFTEGIPLGERAISVGVAVSI